MIRGERGPTGDHGQTGDVGADGTDGIDGSDGDTGRPGRDGIDGARGQTGLVGAPAPRKSPIATILFLVALLSGLAIVAASIAITFRAQNQTDRAQEQTDRTLDDNERLIADRDAVRAQLDDIQAHQELEQETDACFDAHTLEINVTAQRTRAAAALMNAASAQMEASIARGLLVFVPVEFLPAGFENDFDYEELRAALAASDVAAAAAEVAARDDNAAVDARTAWVQAGRPLPCPLDSD